MNAPFSDIYSDIAQSPVGAEWRLHALDQVDSTSNVAADLPAWSAVQAKTQSAGRGRTGRTWVSDEGGLWLSAVLPCDCDERVWQYLPLAIGWSLAITLTEIGVGRLRVRWPNDLMVGQRKLAGILAERFNPDRVVVGIGINIFNSPHELDPQLKNATIRLSDLMLFTPTLEKLTLKVLFAIRTAYDVLRQEGFSRIAQDLNSCWTENREVELILAGHHHPVKGRFQGIDGKGALRITTANGASLSYGATQVALLTEVN